MATGGPPGTPVLAGHIDAGVIDSPALRGNPLGDPSHRQVYVYLPPAYDAEPHYLHVYVSQLRRKLEPDPARPTYLLTEPGAGYRLVDPSARESPQRMS